MNPTRCIDCDKFHEFVHYYYERYPGSGSCDFAQRNVLQEPRWIPTSERLPNKSQWVLVTTEDYQKPVEIMCYQGIRIGRRNIGNGWEEYKYPSWTSGHGDIQSRHPKAWMPLPKLFEPQEEEKMKRIEQIEYGYQAIAEIGANYQGDTKDIIEIQKISVLHQISETLAMMYDKLTEEEEDEEQREFDTDLYGNEWIFDRKDRTYECSNCGESVANPSPECPWCGAKMNEPPVCCSECDHCTTEIAGTGNTMGGAGSVRVYGKCTATNHLLYNKITKNRPEDCPLGFYKFGCTISEPDKIVWPRKEEKNHD